jgi:molybdopterin-guanine dinucleotide biosynthesis protein A
LKASGIVLAGGKSTRLGRNKVAEIIGQQTLLTRVVSRLRVIAEDIVIVTARDSTLPQLADYSGITVVYDIFPERGSIGGIYSGLCATQAERNLVVAGDMPFLNVDLLSYMLSISPDCDVVVPRTDTSIFEPLHAVYSRNCIPPLESLVKQNVFRIIELFPLVSVRYIESAEIERFDPQHLSFFNINTEADLEKGRAIAKKEDVSSD